MYSCEHIIVTAFDGQESTPVKSSFPDWIKANCENPELIAEILPRLLKGEFITGGGGAEPLFMMWIEGMHV